MAEHTHQEKDMHSPGHRPDPSVQHPSELATHKQAERDAWDMWEVMSEPERLEIILTRFEGAQWFEESPLSTLATFRDHPITWGRIKTIGKSLGVTGWDLEKATDAWLAQHANGETPVVKRRPCHDQELLVPPLPEQAQLHPELAEGAAPWLDAYCAHSQIWAPRAARGFHAAIGLWMLSAVSARRVCVHLGKPKYPMLFLALVAPSSL